MENIQRTIYASYLQTCLILQQPIIYPSFSTLNEKFNIGVDKIVSPTTYPKVQYAVIGNGGHKMQVDSTGFYVPVPAQHEATDACLFNHIPFVLREIDDDLTDDEIANYRLRIPVVYNNITYIAYYAKILDMSEATPALISKSIASGTVTSSPYTTTVNNLDPKPVDLTTVAANLVNNNYVGTLSLAKLTLTANDVTEILNAANIIYGNPNKAIVVLVILIISSFIKSTVITLIPRLLVPGSSASMLA